MKNDIATKEDIKLMVDMFYKKVMKDALLSPVFSHVDWENHLPIMYNFWSSMIFGDKSYSGNPFQNHIALKITSDHFRQWLVLFTLSIDQHFEGSKTEEIKERAKSIGDIFQYKLGLLDKS